MTVPMVTPCGKLKGAEPSAASSVLCSISWRISKGTLFLESSQWRSKAPWMSSLQERAVQPELCREQGPAQAVGVTFE